MRLLTKKLLILTGLLMSSIGISATASEMKPGTIIGKHIHGLARDFQGDPLLIGSDPLIYEKVDYQLGLRAANVSFNVELFNGDIASGYLTELSAEDRVPVDTNSVDFGPIGGAHSIGGAIKSAWGTVLYSETSLVDGSNWEEFVSQFKPFFKNNIEMVKPYNYGWINELILLDEKGNAKAIKNYVAGRTFASNIIAMPDGKTFYLHDEQQSGNLYLFIADEANSFAKGALYVVSNDGVPHALGKSSALKMKFKLRKASFSSFFKAKNVEQAECTGGFTFIKTVYGDECLKIEKKNKKYVGQFEPIRMAAIKGVTPFSVNTEMSFDSHQSVIKLKHNSGEISQYKLSENAELGTKYFITY